MADINTTAGLPAQAPQPAASEGPFVSEPLDLFSAEDGDSVRLPLPAGQPDGTAVLPGHSVALPGTSHEPVGAVRSSPDAAPAATASDAVSVTVPDRAGARAGGLAAMLLPDLQRVAQSLGITGTARMRKGQLIAAIEERRQHEPRQAGTTGSSHADVRGQAVADQLARDQRPRASLIDSSDNPVQREVPAGAGANRTFEQDAMESQNPTQPGLGASSATGIGEATHPVDTGIGSGPAGGAAFANATTAVNGTVREETQQAADGQRPERRRRPNQRVQDGANQRVQDGADQSRAASDGQDREVSGSGREQSGRDSQASRDQANRDQGSRDQGSRDQGSRGDDDRDGGGSSRRSRDRYRNRNGGSRRRERGAGGSDAEPVISEDDVLIPIAGILDVLDNYGFVRTTGYLPGPNDVYVSLSQVRRYGLRKGDVIEGAIRQPREGERREKFNALVRLDKINGLDPEQSKTRPEFTKLVPLYPQDRLRLESDP